MTRREREARAHEEPVLNTSPSAQERAVSRERAESTMCGGQSFDPAGGMNMKGGWRQEAGEGWSCGPGGDQA